MDLSDNKEKSQINPKKLYPIVRSFFTKNCSNPFDYFDNIFCPKTNVKPSPDPIGSSPKPQKLKFKRKITPKTTQTTAKSPQIIPKSPRKSTAISEENVPEKSAAIKDLKRPENTTENTTENPMESREETTTSEEAAVIVVDSANEAEEFTAENLIWKFGGGMKIGSTYFYNKDFIPTANFLPSKMTVRFMLEGSTEVTTIDIDYDDIFFIESFLAKKCLQGCIRFVLHRELTREYVKDSKKNNRIELYFNEFTRMVEENFFERLKTIPILESLLADEKEDADHNYNTRSTKRTRIDKRSCKKVRKNMEALKIILTYPKNGTNSVSVTEKDLKLLEPCEMLNDTIVDFYLRYLEEKVKGQSVKIHFFNTFFYKMLERTDAVSNWTKKVNIFDFDFVVFPINIGMHWKAVVLCHPLNSIKPEKEWRSENDCPRLIHLDSMKGHRRQKKSFMRIRRFLTLEYKAKLNEDFEFNSLNLPGFDMELPKQVNSVDCGVYLLEFIERLCKRPYANTSCKATIGSYEFSPKYIVSKRKEIKDLILKLAKE